jgi:LmbE family N-acetylglucosaminyl deacetylase
MRILCVFAHPDDECYCAGTLAKLVKEVTPDHDGHYQKNHSIRVIFMNDGVGIRRFEPARHRNEPVNNTNERRENRLKELGQSMNLIGIHDYQVYETPNMRMDTIPQLEVNRIVEDDIVVFKPDLIITHYGDDLNEDHRRTFTAVKIATRLRPESIIKGVICTDNDQSRDIFKPTMYVDIKEEIHIKKKCMESYRTEWQKPPGERNEETMELMARYNGYKSGSFYAENFQILFLKNPILFI